MFKLIFLIILFHIYKYSNSQYNYGYPYNNNNNNYNYYPQANDRPRVYYPYKSQTPFQESKDCLSKGKVLPCDSLPKDDPDNNVQIIDVSPEYHQQLLGVAPSQNVPQYGQTYNNINNKPQVTTTYQTRYLQPTASYPPVYYRRPQKHYRVYFQSSNNTYAPRVVTSKPLNSIKVYNTTFKRTFVIDPSKPNQSLNLTFVNGEMVTEKPQELRIQENEETTTVGTTTQEATTTEVVTTTENEDTPKAVESWSLFK